MATNSFIFYFHAVLSGLGVALLFSLAVFIHELGHFLAARWMGLTIDAFSIGFGPAIWKRKIGDTEYRIGCVPFGGYVALPQLDPSGMEKIQGSHGDKPQDQAEADVPAVRQLKDIAPWRRIIVAAAGPLGNLVLATILAWVIFLTPDSGAGGADTTIGHVQEASGAHAVGLRAGDQIVSINGNRINNWNEFLVECHLSGDASNGLAVVVRRGEERLALNLPVMRDPDAGFVKVDGIGPRIPCVVGEVMTNSAAELAGLLPGDMILSLDGQFVASPEAMIARVDSQGGQPITVGFMRGDRQQELIMTPRFHAEAGRHLVGIVFDGQAGQADQWMQYRDPWLQLKHDASGVFRILRALFNPQAKGEARRAASGLSGPLVIVVMLWYQVRRGLIVALAFLRFLCVNLALLNLLPLPVLDGGHIVFALYEMITRRKPNAKFVTWLSNGFAVLLIGLMVLLVFRDVLSLKRFSSIRRRAEAEAVRAAEPAAPMAGGVVSGAVERVEEAP